MQVTTERSENALILHLSGRLDGAGGRELEENVRNSLGDDDRAVLIGMADVPYISSAGLRVILSLTKEMERRQGMLGLVGTGEFARKVIDMTGFSLVIPLFPAFEEAAAAARKVTGRRLLVEDITQPSVSVDGTQIRFERGKSGKSVLRVGGDVHDIVYSRLTPEKVKPKRFTDILYALGVGALGETREQAMTSLGEMMSIHGAVVWEPTDGSGTPDFIIPARDTGEVPVFCGFSVALDGPFHDLISIESNNRGGITLLQIYRAIFDYAYRNRPEFHGIAAIALRGITAGVGRSALIRPPLRILAPKGDLCIFDPACVADWIAVHEAPEYESDTLMLFGIGVDPAADLSVFNQDVLSSLWFIHPENTGPGGLFLHNHGVIFRDIPWNTRDDLHDQIRRLVTEGEFVDMCHLLDSTRVRTAQAGVAYIGEVVRDP